MIPASFRYAAPRSVAEAVDLLRGNEDAKVLAGGHSLLPLMKLRLANPPVLVDINRIPNLNYIREDAQLGRLRIGARRSGRRLAGGAAGGRGRSRGVRSKGRTHDPHSRAVHRDLDDVAFV